MAKRNLSCPILNGDTRQALCEKYGLSQRDATDALAAAGRLDGKAAELGPEEAFNTYAMKKVLAEKFNIGATWKVQSQAFVDRYNDWVEQGYINPDTGQVLSNDPKVFMSIWKAYKSAVMPGEHVYASSFMDDNKGVHIHVAKPVLDKGKGTSRGRLSQADGMHKVDISIPVDLKNAQEADPLAIRTQITDMTGDQISLAEARKMKAQAILAAKLNSSLVYTIGRKTKALNALRKGFDDPRKLDFLASYFSRKFSSAMKALTRDPRAKKLLFTNDQYPGVDFTKMSLNDIRNDSQLMTTLLRNIIRAETCPARQNVLNNEKAKAELNTVFGNTDAMVHLCSTYLQAMEGIRIDFSGKAITEGDVQTDTLNESDRDEEVDLGESEMSSDTLDLNSAESSAMSKALPEVKRLISGIPNVGRDGKIKLDPYGYGMATYIEPSKVLSSVYKWCRGCTTKSQMFSRLARQSKSTPWVKTLLLRMGSNPETGDFNPQNGQQERLSTQFFCSVRVCPTIFASSWTRVNPDGTITPIIGNLNGRKGRAKALARTENLYKSGKIYALNHPESIVPAVKNVQNFLYNDQMKAILNNEDALAALLDNEGNIDTSKRQNNPLLVLKNFINAIGIDVDDKALVGYVMSDVGSGQKVARLIGDIAHIYNNGIDKFVQENNARTASKQSPLKTSALFDGNNAFSIRSTVNKIYEYLDEYGEDAAEGMVHAASKNYAVYNFPTYSQTVVEAIKCVSGDERATQKFFEENYRKFQWYTVFNSKTGTWTYYSDILAKCSGGPTSRSSRARLSLRSLLDHNGTEYYDQSDLDTYLQIMTLFFGEKTNGEAWYKTNIASDKKEFAALRWRRINGEYDPLSDSYTNDEIANKCFMFGQQEVSRARTVLASLLNNNAKIKGYDPSFKNKERAEQHERVLNKVRSGEKVTRDDVIDKKGHYLYRGSGMGFCMQTFLNEVIEKNDNPELANAIIDTIFNNQNTYSEKIELFKDEFKKHMDELMSSELKEWTKAGLMEGTDVNYTWSSRDEFGNVIEGAQNVWKRHSARYFDSWIMDIYRQRKREFQKDHGERFDDVTDDNFKQTMYDSIFKEMLYDFLYNNYWMRIETTELFAVDPAFYGNVTNFQKRNAQSRSSGVRMDTEVTVHGQKLTDGKNRSITLATEKNIKAEIMSNVEAALRNRKNPFEGDPVRARQWAKENNVRVKEVLEAIAEIDPTDGQSFTCLTALRKKLAGRGEWSFSRTSEMDDDPNCMTDEAVYRRFTKGTTTEADLQHVFSQVTKPFSYWVNDKVRNIGDGEVTHVAVPTQNKNSEYALAYLMAYTANWQPGSVTEAIFKFMEESHYSTDSKGNRTYRQDGIDAVHFDSAVKVGEVATIKVSQNDSPKDVIERLNAGTYNKDHKAYNNDYVTTTSFDGYMKQQIIPEHFKKHSQQMGSQARALMISQVDDAEQMTVPGKEGTVSGKEFKETYFDKLNEKLSLASMKAREDFALDAKDDPEDKPDGKTARQKINAALSRALDNGFAGSTRKDFEDRQAVSLDEKGEFTLSLEDPSHSREIQATLMADIRRRLYKMMFKGGPVVQTTSWGQKFAYDGKNFSGSKKADLHVKFKSSDGKPLMSEEEFNNSVERSKYASYTEYCSKNQNGLDYVEARIPMTEDMRRLLTDENGHLETDWAKVQDKLPAGMLDAIVYRIPTEGPYSMYPIKVVGFTEEASGDSIQLPLELTKFAGFDFDIDKLFVVLKEYKINRNTNVGDDTKRPTYSWQEYDDVINREKQLNNEIFDMQYEAMRTAKYFESLSVPISIDDIIRHSYRAALLRTGLYEVNEVLEMSDSELKEEAEMNEQYDLTRPSTDVLLHRLNSAAKELIGINAVNNIAHTFFSEISQTVPVKITFDGSARFCGVSLGGDVQIDSKYDANGFPLGDNVRKYIGASTDGGKEPALGRLGINKHIINQVQFLLRAGFSTEAADIFAAQPVIQRYIRMYENAVNSGYANVDDIIDQLEELRCPDASMRETFKNYKEHADGGRIDIDLNSMYDRLRRSDDSMYRNNDGSINDVCFDIHTLEFLRALTVAANRMQKISSITRLNSVSSGPRKSISAYNNQKAKLDDLYITLGAGGKGYSFGNASYSDFKEGLSFLYEMDARTRELVDEIVKKNFPSYQSAMYDGSINEIENYLNKEELSDETVEALHDAMLMYCMHKPYLTCGDNVRNDAIMRDALVNMANPDVARRYLVNFVDRYEAALKNIAETMPRVYKEEIQNNAFLNEIFIKGADRNHPVRSLRTELSLDDDTKRNVKNAWDALLKSSHKEVRQLGMELYTYFCVQGNGFGFHPQTPTHLAPLDAKLMTPHRNESLNDYDFYSASTDLTGNYTDFVMQFMLNNLEDNSLVRRFNDEYLLQKGAITLRDDKETGTRIMKINLNDVTKSVLKPLIIRTKKDGPFVTATIRGIMKADDNHAYLIVPSRNGRPNLDSESVALTHKVTLTSATEFTLIPIRRLGVKNQVLEYRPGMDLIEGSVFEGIDTSEMPVSSEVVDRKPLEANNPDEIIADSKYADRRVITYEDVQAAASSMGINLDEYFNKNTFNMNAEEVTRTLREALSPEQVQMSHATLQDLIDEHVLRQLGFRVTDNNWGSETTKARINEAVQPIYAIAKQYNLC